MNLHISGSDYVPSLDQERLENQFKVILELMSDGVWRACEEIAEITGFRNVSSVSAQLRNLRKDGYKVERRNRDGRRGHSEYRLVKEQILAPVQFKDNNGQMEIVLKND